MKVFYKITHPNGKIYICDHLMVDRLRQADHRPRETIHPGESSEENPVMTRQPLHNKEYNGCFGYPGVSPAMMGACAEINIGLCSLPRTGGFCQE